MLFEQAEIEGYIAEFLGIGQRDSRLVLRAMEAQHGLLIERAQKVWSFSHLTFHEYFVAQKFIIFNGQFTDSEIKQLLNRHILDNNWHEVFRLISERNGNE